MQLNFIRAAYSLALCFVAASSITRLSATKVIFDLKANVPRCFYEDAPNAGVGYFFGFANVSFASPISAQILAPSKKVVEDFNVSETEYSFTGDEAGPYSFCFVSTRDCQIDLEVSMDAYADADKTATEAVSPLRTSLNGLKGDLRNLYSTLKHIKARATRNMMTVETIESHILKFSAFEVVLLISMSIVSVVILKTYFKNHMKKGTA